MSQEDCDSFGSPKLIPSSPFKENRSVETRSPTPLSGEKQLSDGNFFQNLDAAVKSRCSAVIYEPKCSSEILQTKIQGTSKSQECLNEKVPSSLVKNQISNDDLKSQQSPKIRKHSAGDSVKRDLIEHPRVKLQTIVEKFDKNRAEAITKKPSRDDNCCIAFSCESKLEQFDPQLKGEDAVDDTKACARRRTVTDKKNDFTERFDEGLSPNTEEAFFTDLKSTQTGAGSRPLSSDMFEMLAKLQSSRLNDQRYSPQKEFVRLTKYPPDVVLISERDFWSEHHEDTHGRYVYPSKFDIESFSKSYRNIFSHGEHFNFRYSDDILGSILLSIKICDDHCYCQLNFRAFGHGSCVHVIARLRDFTLQKTFFSMDLDEMSEPVASKLAKQMLPLFGPVKFDTVLFPRASAMLIEFDEHRITNKYKFGLIYQKPGQSTEEEMFSNQSHSKEMTDFMNCIGTIIKLSSHDGYKGGLDTAHGYTGELSLYETFKGNEIMFHVSTFLPFQEMDSQQVQKKCHIGNDIVAIIFQDKETSFDPSMIKSSFLHAFIVVQNVRTTSDPSYKVKVFAKSDVPQFAPLLPKSGVFKKGPEFKEFFLSKLLNAETACYQSRKFSFLERRTRTELFTTLDQMTAERTQDFLLGSSKLEGDKWQAPGILGTWRRAFSSKVRPSSTSEFKERDPKISQSCRKKEKQNSLSSPVKMRSLDVPLESRSNPFQQAKSFLSPNFMRKFTMPLPKSPRRSCIDFQEINTVSKVQSEDKAEGFRKSQDREFLMSSSMDTKDSKILNLQAENARLQNELSVIRIELEALKREKNNNIS